jgi:hypothetical protein
LDWFSHTDSPAETENKKRESSPRIRKFFMTDSLTFGRSAESAALRRGSAIFLRRAGVV